MARTCVLAAICATLRRSNGIRSVSAFSTKPSTVTRGVASHGALFMSTDAAANVVVPRVKAADALEPTDHPVVVKGWVRTVRKQKTLAFVEVNDGSNLSGIQAVLSFDSIDEDTKKGRYSTTQILKVRSLSFLLLEL